MAEKQIRTRVPARKRCVRCGLVEPCKSHYTFRLRGSVERVKALALSPILPFTRAPALFGLPILHAYIITAELYLLQALLYLLR